MPKISLSHNSHAQKNKKMNYVDVYLRVYLKLHKPSKHEINMLLYISTIFIIFPSAADVKKSGNAV